MTDRQKRDDALLAPILAMPARVSIPSAVARMLEKEGSKSGLHRIEGHRHHDDMTVLELHRRDYVHRLWFTHKEWAEHVRNGSENWEQPPLLPEPAAQ